MPRAARRSTVATCPTTPWATNGEGRGPAWANSLFEDNAEFGLGIRMGLDAEERAARALLGSLAGAVGTELAASVLEADQDQEEGVFAQRQRVARLKEELDRLAAGDNEVTAAAARHLAVLADALVRKGVWIVGGDGWAYDIGFGGLDHVLSSGRNINILVLDTEVYSNTGGQASKATQRGAMAKFAAAGKETAKKDLGRRGPGLRQRLCGPDLDGRQRLTGDQGPCSRPRLTRALRW